MKIYLTIFIFALILLYKFPEIKSKNLIKKTQTQSEKKTANKFLLNNNSNNNNNKNTPLQKSQEKFKLIKKNTTHINNNKNKNNTSNTKNLNINIKLLNSTRNFYKEAEKSAENFLREISNLVISDFEILKENKLEGISLEVLKNMIQNDQEFFISIPEKEIEMKFKEYDIMKKGYLDKISYSGILSEFIIAKAAIKKLNKFFDEGIISNSTNFENENENFNENFINKNGANFINNDSMRLNNNNNNNNNNKNYKK
jgi:hypothetical protein